MLRLFGKASFCQNEYQYTLTCFLGKKFAREMRMYTFDVVSVDKDFVQFVFLNNSTTLL